MRLRRSSSSGRDGPARTVTGAWRLPDEGCGAGEASKAIANALKGRHPRNEMAREVALVPPSP